MYHEQSANAQKMGKKKAGRIASRPNKATFCFGLPVDAQAKLQAARLIALKISAAAQHAPCGCVREVEAGIVSLHVVQHVGEIEVQGAADPLRDVDFLGDAQIQVPEWQALQRAATTNLSIQAE